MGIDSDMIADDWHAALAALAWQVDLGVDEVIGDAPLNRYDLPEALARPQSALATPAAPPPALAGQPNPDSQQTAPTPDLATAVAAARQAAEAAESLEMLHSAIAAYVHCPLRRGARNTVFADGNPAAHVMILGEAPDVDEDRAAKPFQGAAGQMLDRMFAAIGIARDSADPASALYLASVLPWKPSGDRDPDPGEIAMMLPFVQRHIELVNPKVIIVMGNAPLFALTGQKGILRARGIWGTAFGIDLLPMTHPKYLLRTLTAKREAWADLLALQARLKGLPQIGSPSR